MFRKNIICTKLKNVLCLLHPLNHAKPVTILFAPTDIMEDPCKTFVAFESVKGSMALNSSTEKCIWVWDELGKVKFKFSQAGFDVFFQRCFSDLKMRFSLETIPPDQMDLLSKLPLTVINCIVEKIDLKDHRSMRLVSRKWNQTAKNNTPPMQLIIDNRHEINLYSMKDGSKKTISICNPIKVVATGSNFIVVACQTKESQEIALFDPLTLKQVNCISFNGDTIHSLVLQNDILYIFSGTYEFLTRSLTLHCIDLNATPLQSPQEPTLTNLKIWSIDGEYVAYSHLDEYKVMVINVQKKIKVVEFLLEEYPTSILFKNGRYLFVRYYTGKILRWTLKDAEGVRQEVKSDERSPFVGC